MRLLLDTQILIWSVFRPARLRPWGATLIEDETNDKFFSAASIWEVAIKRALQRVDFDVDPAELMEVARLDFTERPVTSSVAARVATLPMHHRDPFDRLLVAQAIDDDALLLTTDAALSAYAPHVLMLGSVPGRVS